MAQALGGGHKQVLARSKREQKEEAQHSSKLASELLAL